MTLNLFPEDTEGQLYLFLCTLKTMHLYRYLFFQNYKVVLTFPDSLFVSSFCDRSLDLSK